jgi:hypothetical protein
MSFLLDPPLLALSGAVIERAAPDPRTADRLAAATLATFLAGSLALYANAPGLRFLWGPFGARDGREFMLTSGLAPARHEAMRRRHHAGALAVFALYPLALAAGRRAGRR